MTPKPMYEDEIGRVLCRDGIVGGRSENMETIIVKVLLALNVLIYIRTAFWILQVEWKRDG